MRRTRPSTKARYSGSISERGAPRDGREGDSRGGMAPPLSFAHHTSRVYGRVLQMHVHSLLGLAPAPSRQGERPRSAATGLAATAPTPASAVGLGRALGGDTLVLLLALGLHTVGVLAGTPNPQHQCEKTEEQNGPDHSEPHPHRDIRP